MKKHNSIFLFFSTIFIFFFSCSQSNSSDSTQEKKPEFITKIAAEEEKQFYSFFIRYNKGNTPVKIGDSGYIDEQSLARNSISNTPDTENLNTSIISGYPILEQRNIEIWNSLRKKQNSTRNVATPTPKIVEINTTSYTVGDKRQFWMMKQFGVPDFEQRNFTLKTMGDHCLVWCEDNLTGDEAITDENKFTQIQQKFDLIYDVETEIFGKAQGYIVSNPQELVSKVDDKINIVIMNPKNPNVGGFFSSNDMILQSAIDSIVENKSQKSNENQIIYINSYKINKDFDFSISAIAHEFQHLLNFIHDCVSLGLDFQMWYSEMLSVLAQDIFHEELSPDSLEPYNRLELFKRFTNYGVTYWTPQPTITDTKCLIGYAVNYAFGAFLFRNYGGVELLKAMTSHENNVIHKDAINYALKKVYPDKNYTFDEIASQLHYIMLTANIDGNLEDNEKVFTLNREIKFTADSSGSEKEITVKRIELSKNSHVTFFNPYGKDELDVIYPYGFLISDLPQGYYQKIVYQKPYDDNIEIILY